MTDRYQRLRDAIAVLDNPPAMKRGRLLSVDENMNARIAWDDPRDDFHLAADPDTIAALLADHDREKSRADSLAEQVRHDYAEIAALLKERDALRDAADMALNVLIGCVVAGDGVDDRRSMLEAQSMLRAALADGEDA